MIWRRTTIEKVQSLLEMPKAAQRWRWDRALPVLVSPTGRKFRLVFVRGHAPAWRLEEVK